MSFDKSKYYDVMRGFYQKKVQYDGVQAAGYSLWECLVREVESSRNTEWTVLGKEYERDSYENYRSYSESKDWDEEYLDYLKRSGYEGEPQKDEKPHCPTCSHSLLTREDWAARRSEDDADTLWEDIVSGARFSDKYDDAEVAAAYKLNPVPKLFHGNTREYEIPDWWWTLKRDSYARVRIGEDDMLIRVLHINREEFNFTFDLISILSPNKNAHISDDDTFIELDDIDDYEAVDEEEAVAYAL